MAVVVVDHGMRRAESADLVQEFVRSSADRLPTRSSEPAHMELSEPSIATAFDRCVARGATTVAVAPWFLGPGHHWDRDIPALTAEVAGRRPGVRWLVAAPLGPIRSSWSWWTAGDPVPRARRRSGGGVRGVRRHGSLHAPLSGRAAGRRKWTSYWLQRSPSHGCSPSRA